MLFISSCFVTDSSLTTGQQLGVSMHAEETMQEDKCESWVRQRAGMRVSFRVQRDREWGAGAGVQGKHVLGHTPVPRTGVFHPTCRALIGNRYACLTLSEANLSPSVQLQPRVKWWLISCRLVGGSFQPLLHTNIRQHCYCTSPLCY